jgi:hypothetical protein
MIGLKISSLPEDMHSTFDNLVSNQDELHFGIGSKGEVANFECFMDSDYRVIPYVNRMIQWQEKFLRNLLGASHKLTRTWSVQYSLEGQYTPLHHHGDDGQVVICTYKSDTDCGPITIMKKDYYPKDYDFICHSASMLHQYYHVCDKERTCFVTVWEKCS